MKRTGHNLFLLECIFALLFFSLAAAVCAQLFGRAFELRQQSKSLDLSVTMAQSAAEAFRSCQGDLEAAASIIGGDIEGNTLTLWADDSGSPAKESDAAYILTLSREEREGVAYGNIVVVSAEDKEKVYYQLQAAFALPKEVSSP